MPKSRVWWSSFPSISLRSAEMRTLTYLVTLNEEWNLFAEVASLRGVLSACIHEGQVVTFESILERGLESFVRTWSAFPEIMFWPRAVSDWPVGWEAPALMSPLTGRTSAFRGDLHGGTIVHPQTVRSGKQIAGWVTCGSRRNYEPLGDLAANAHSLAKTIFEKFKQITSPSLVPLVRYSDGTHDYWPHVLCSEALCRAVENGVQVGHLDSISSTWSIVRIPRSEARRRMRTKWESARYQVSITALTMKSGLIGGYEVSRDFAAHESRAIEQARQAIRECLRPPYSSSVDTIEIRFLVGKAPEVNLSDSFSESLSKKERTFRVSVSVSFASSIEWTTEREVTTFLVEAIEQGLHKFVERLTKAGLDVEADRLWLDWTRAKQAVYPKQPDASSP